MVAAFSVGLGLGFALALVATLPLLLRAWGAYRRETQRETNDRIAEQVFVRVSGILADIKHTQEAEGRPDPVQQQNVAEAALFKIAAMGREYERMREWMAHVAAGGQPDDPPSKWMKGISK